MPLQHSPQKDKSQNPLGIASQSNEDREIPGPSVDKDKIEIESETRKIIANDKIELPENKKQIVIMANAQPNVSIKYALEAVPIFDGHNIPLLHFIEGCQEAKDMLAPENEAALVRVLRNKLRGEARRAIHGTQYATVEELCKFLKSVYNPAKTVYQLHGELGAIYQKSGESVLSYANRINDLGNRIIDAHKTENNGQTDNEFKASLDKALIQYFIQGLDSAIEGRVKEQETLKLTMIKAIEIEKKLQDRAALRKDTYRTPIDANARASSQPHVNKRIHLVQKDVVICQICQKPGHTADKC